MSGANYFPANLDYSFDMKPSNYITRPLKILKNLGQIPYRPLQPNGWSDNEADWVSPEFLFRRIGILKRLEMKNILGHLNNDKLKMIIKNNFDNHDEILNYLNKVDEREKSIALFCSKWRGISFILHKST